MPFPSSEKIEEISVNVLPRIKERLCGLVDLYTERDDMYWMAFGENSRAANWNPWITSNMLVTAFTVVDDKEKLQKFVYKALRVLDRYYEVYPMDGACDEGPVYWTQAGLSFMEDLWLLKLGTDGQIDLFDDEKVKNQRVNALLRQQKIIQKDQLKKYINKSFNCLIKTINGVAVGITDGGREIYIPNYKFNNSNYFATVKVDDIRNHKLSGVII